MLAHDLSPEEKMTRKLSLMITWQFDMKKEDAIALAKIADECGVDSFWVPEGWASAIANSLQ